MRNNGSPDATGVVVVDDFPVGLTPVEVPSDCTMAGQSVTCTVPEALNQFDPPFIILVRARAELAAAGRTLTNTATATAVGGSTASAFLDVPIGPYSVLAATMAASPASVVAGSSVTFTATIRNAGPSPAEGVRLVDLLEGGLLLRSATPTQGTCAGLACDLGAIPADGAARVEVVADVDVSVSGRRLSTVEATASAFDA